MRIKDGFRMFLLGVGLCGGLYAHGDLHPEIAKARARAKAAPQDPQAHLALAELLQRHGDLGQAILAYEAAAQIKKDLSPQAWLGLAYCANRQGQPAKAETAAREATRLLPKEAKGHFELGMALQSQARLGPASQAFAQAFALAPGPDKALAWIRCAASSAEWNETRQHVETVRQRLGDLASLLEAAVSLARGQEEFKDALKWHDARLQAEGEQALLLETRGDILSDMGKKPKARQAWAKALEAWKLMPESRRQTPALLGLPERVKVKGGGA